ncbi:uncharacterized protein LOC128740148 [Sabethes cyaneus]|uniref:uncharacterized protein LOC128740148 n=1 Tax=Sabethes cyaneus TaxID=53552 RepID=UPI00237DC4C9|nr:uncharacterized protein LOC128740148 [Sabethes cyaneus]
MMSNARFRQAISSTNNAMQAMVDDQNKVLDELRKEIALNTMKINTILQRTPMPTTPRIPITTNSRKRPRLIIPDESSQQRDNATEGTRDIQPDDAIPLAAAKKEKLFWLYLSGFDPQATVNQIEKLVRNNLNTEKTVDVVKLVPKGKTLEELTFTEADVLEQTAVRIAMKDGNIFICAVFLPPNSDPVLYERHAACTQQLSLLAKDRDKTIVLGDYNLPHLRWDYDDEMNCFLPMIASAESELDKLESSWEEFNEVQEDIAELDTKDELEEETNKAYADFEEQYYEFRAELLRKLPVTSPANLDTTVARNSSLSGLNAGVRLPQISLPEFDGDYKGWLSFKSTFVSLIHESTELNDVQKFHYLKSALRGEAATLVESLTISSGNYLIAWDTITKRYSNEYLLKKRHLQALMEFPRIEKESAGLIHKLVDEFDQRLKILKQLGEKTEHWCAMIIHWMCSKLDKHTLQLWEDHAASLRDPTFTVLVDFLEKRTRVLEAVLSNSNYHGTVQQKATFRRERIAMHASAEGGNNESTCLCCGNMHYLVRCAKFQNFGLKEKLDFVNSNRLCSNCLKTGHWVRDCNSKYSCKTCDRKHNNLIHPGFQPGKGGNGSSKSLDVNRSTIGLGKSNDTARAHVVAEAEEDQQNEEAEEVPAGLYNIVIVAIKDQHGGMQLARALLDNGSQVNVMSERLCQMLKLKRRSICVPIIGVGQSESMARYAVKTTIRSRINDFSIGLDFLVLQRVTSDLPSVTVPVSHWNIPENIQLADPQFNISGRIDPLLGAEHFFNFLYEKETKRIILGPQLPIIVDSVFGWIVTGRDESLQQGKTVRCCTATTSEKVEYLLEKFWRVESCEDQPAWSKEEQDCKANFKATHSRTPDGRYIIQLPKRVNWDRMLGESHAVALDRYRKLENRLEHNPDMKQQYHAFMQEYLDMGHMQQVTQAELQAEVNGNNPKKFYYLPHHAVMKEPSTTTKVRVVFDASARTDSGYSLNDVLLKGPVIQDDLLNLPIRFRKHDVALVGDVEKMYRQVLHDNSDTLRLRIFFRFSKDNPIGIYELLTVTYGLTPSSFLATRALQQLATDEGTNVTQAQLALQNDFYVDDYIGGAANVDEAIELRKGPHKEPGFVESRSGHHRQPRALKAAIRIGQKLRFWSRIFHVLAFRTEVK